MPKLLIFALIAICTVANAQADCRGLTAQLKASEARDATAARLPHAVILYSVGAQHEYRVGPIKTIGHLEKLFVKAALPLTAVRPGYFLENIQDVLPAVLHEGIYPSMILPLDRKIDMVATVDIGLTVADALINPPSVPHRVIELRGAAQFSAQDITATLSKALGREIAPIEVPGVAWVDQLKQNGLSQQSAESIAEMHENIYNGRIDFLDATLRKGHIDLTRFVETLNLAASES